MKAAPHTSQEKGFSPVCVRSCICRWLRFLNALLQTSHLKRHSSLHSFDSAALFLLSLPDPWLLVSRSASDGGSVLVSAVLRAEERRRIERIIFITATPTNAGSRIKPCQTVTTNKAVDALAWTQLKQQRHTASSEIDEVQKSRFQMRSARRSQSQIKWLKIRFGL